GKKLQRSNSSMPSERWRISTLPILIVSLATSRRLSERVEAPGTCAGRGQVEEDEAEEHRQLAAVLQRQRRARRVDQEVRGRHLAGADERGQMREEAEQDERAPHDLDHAGRAQPRGERHGGTGGGGGAREELLRAVP